MYIFAQALSDMCDIQLSKLPPKVIVGDSMSVKISQDDPYESGLEDCKCNLHGRLTLYKGDSPLTTKALKIRLNELWSSLKNQTVIPLGNGYYEFKFNIVEDMRKILAIAVVNLMPNILILLLDKRFHTPTSSSDQCQIWVGLMHMPQEYWRKKNMRSPMELEPF